jgi:hypothetical protein
VALDGGVVPEGRLVNLRFRFHNGGHTAVSIADVSGSCGVFPSIVEGSTLQPGETGILEAHLVTVGRSGLLTGTVTVKFREPAEREVTLSVKSVVEPEFVLGQGIIDFGQIRSGEELQREVTIQVKSSARSIVSARTSDAHFEASVVGTGASDTVTVVVSAKGLDQPGLKRGTVRVSTSSPDMPELIVPLRAVVASS